MKVLHHNDQKRPFFIHLFIFISAQSFLYKFFRITFGQSDHLSERPLKLIITLPVSLFPGN